MRPWKTLLSDTLLAIGMILSLAYVYTTKDRFNEWFFVFPAALVCFFAVPLSQVFQHGIARARSVIQDEYDKSASMAFHSVLWPHVGVWFALWGIYFISLEARFFQRGSFGQAIISALGTGLILLMFAACCIWAPRCKALWSLVLLTLLTPVLVATPLYVLGLALVAALGMSGYMGLGFAFYPPLFTSIILVIGAIGTWVWAWRRGNAWFQ